MVQTFTPIVVDTNCFLRLLDWEPRPFVGQVVGGYKLVTTEKLVVEAMSQDLQERYPRLKHPLIQRELKAAALRYPPAVQKTLRADTDEFRLGANGVIATHCAAQKTRVRSLSDVDASLWATAVYAKGALATDEWPLTLAAETIPFDDDGNVLQVFSSVQLLHMLETAGKLDSAGRWNMMRQWRQEREYLHRDADEQYRQLFGEAPPTAQSPRR